MAKRKLAARINLLSAREVLNARDCELVDGGGLLLRCTGERAAWVFRYTAPTGRRRPPADTATPGDPRGDSLPQRPA